jgi:DNA-binding response OmpR family regulator
MDVLCIEDDPAIQRLVKLVLGHAGYSVEVVPNGREGIDRLGLKTYDVILLDLMLPVLNGFQVLEWLRERDSSLMRRVVVITAASTRDVKRIREGDVFAVLRKPFDIEELLRTVRACIDQKA